MSRLLEAPPRGRPPGHRRRPRYGFRRLVAVLVLFTLGVLVWRSGVVDSLFSKSKRSETVAPKSRAKSPSGATNRATTTPPIPPPAAIQRTPGPINTKFPGLTTFRGNASRSYYGEGPLPKHPEILWRYPTSGGLCSKSNNL